MFRMAIMVHEKVTAVSTLHALTPINQGPVNRAIRKKRAGQKAKRLHGLTLAQAKGGKDTKQEKGNIDKVQIILDQGQY